MPVRGLILVTFFVLSLPICFVRPFYGIVMWIIVAFLNPQSYTWSAADAVPWAVAVAVPTIAGAIFFSRGWSVLSARGNILLCLLWLWFTLTTVVSTNTPLFLHHAADTWYRWNFVSKILLMTVLTVVIVDSFERLRVFVITMASCFGVFVAKAFPFIIATGGSHRLYGPDRSMVADNNDFGLALNMTLPLFFFLAQTEEKAWMRKLCWALFFMTVPAIFFTYSRGALLGLIAVSVAMLLKLKQRLVLIPLIALAVIFAVMFAPDSWKYRMNPTRKDAVDASAQARLNSWAYARNLAADYPITGGGFATFTAELYSRYAPNYTAQIYGPHSVYFQLLGEHGYPGLLLFLVLVGSTLQTTMRVRKIAQQYDDNVIVQYANMFQFSMVGFLISGFFLGRAYFDYFYSIVACVIILDRVVWVRWAEEDEAHDAYRAGAALEEVPL